MADDDRTSGADARHPSSDGTEPVLSLQPREYLTWLRDLERGAGIGEGVRAYLVSIDTVDGVRRLTPVGRHDSILNLHTDLKKHLANIGFEKDFFYDLLQFCLEQLGEETVPCDLPGDFGARANVVRRAAFAIDDIVDVLQNFDGEQFEGAACRTLLAQIDELAGVVMSAVSDYRDSVEEMIRRASCLEVDHG